MSINLLDKIKRAGKRGIVAGLIATSTFYSCSKDDSMEIYIEPEIEIIKEPDTKILGSADLNSISNLDDSNIYFSQPMDYLVGDIIVGGVSEKTPYGILEKITNVSSDKKSFGITDSFISEAIDEGEFSLNKKLTINDLENKINSKIVKSKNSDYEFSYPIDKVLYDMDGNLETVGDQIRMSGEILFNMEVDLDLKFNKGLKYFNFKTVTEVESNLELKCGSENIINSIDEKKILYDEYFAPIVIPTPLGFPLVIIPNIEIEAGVEGELNGEVTSNIGAKLNLKNELVYEFSEWNKNTESNIEFYYEAQDSYFKTNIKGYVEPKLNLLVYGGPGPFASIENYLKLNIDPDSNPWLKLDGGVKAKVGVDMGIFDELIPNYEKVVWEFEKRLIESTNATTESIWEDDFESYQEGSFPDKWNVSGYSANNRDLNKIINENQNNIFLLYARGWNCTPSAAYRDLAVTPPYEISLKMRNGSMTGYNDEECRKTRGYLQINELNSWNSESEVLFHFDKDGYMISRAKDTICKTELNKWKDIKVQYYNGEDSKLIYYVDGERLHEESAEGYREFTNLGLKTQFVHVYFDDIKVKKIN